MPKWQKNDVLVSICIPSYNAEETIGKTIRSILAQTYRNLEIIVVDNASTDSTLSILNQFNDKRIKIYKNRKNIGAERNWNVCIELAQGEYIAIFHADDIYDSTIVEKQLKILKGDNEIKAVFTRAKYIDRYEKIIGESEIPMDLGYKRHYDFPEIFISILRNNNSFLKCPSAMVRALVYKQLKIFRVDLFGTSADLDMWLRILEQGHIAILNEALLCYRISNFQGSFKYNNLRTEEADYFRVMNFYLENEIVKDLPNAALINYELERSRDRITRSINYLLMREHIEAKRLLRKNISAKALKLVPQNTRNIKLIIYFLFGIILFLSIYLGFATGLASLFRRVIKMGNKLE